MATLHLTMKGSAEPLEIETSNLSAMRVLNRYTLFIQSGNQSGYKFLLDPPASGFVALSFENVSAVMVQTDAGD